MLRESALTCHVCVCVYSHYLHTKLMSIGCYSCASGDCVYYKLSGFTESSPGFKLTVSGLSPGSFDVGHSILCSVFSASSILQYSHLLLLLYCQISSIIVTMAVMTQKAHVQISPIFCTCFWWPWLSPSLTRVL